jgi:nitroimidazol reductase NimA-like FMN-containing flavoprotein (pyridoxamine 5'-phosphate oxidase superfamily)
MNREECLRVLAQGRLARLACARENQPYVVPVYLAYDKASGCLYGFTSPGQKVAWMRANPLVCVELDEVAAYDQWVSVIATGRYEELPETPGSNCAGLRAQEHRRQVGEAVPTWSADSRHRQCDNEGYDEEWCQPGIAAWAARAHRDPAEPFTSVYYRIRIDRVTGHEATRDARDAISCAVAATPGGTMGWLRRTLTRVFGGRSKEAGSAY